MEMVSSLLALSEENHQWLVDSPHKRPVMQDFDIFFEVSLNKLLNKQSISQWLTQPPSALFDPPNISI